MEKKRNFVSSENLLDEEFKRQTVGLVPLEEFKRIRTSLQLSKQKQTKTKTSQVKHKPKPILSFEFDQDDNDCITDSKNSTDDDSKIDLPPLQNIKKITKDPNAKTVFINDQQHSQAQMNIIQNLKQEWILKQEIAKDELIKIEYMYFDGIGHYNTLTCKRGSSIEEFLGFCRDQHSNLANVSRDNLMFIKDGLILPNHYTFYEFLLNKTRGPNGVLFSHDIHSHDWNSEIQTHERYIGKLVEKNWYMQNLHIFPCSKWTPFDSLVKY